MTTPTHSQLIGIIRFHKSAYRAYIKANQPINAESAKAHLIAGLQQLRTELGKESPLNWDAIFDVEAELKKFNALKIVTYNE